MEDVYEHYVPDVKERPEYPGCNNHVLIKSIDELREALRNGSKYIAWDTETSSLDPSTGKLVGFSFSFDGKTGYYVPLQHFTGTNLPNKEALDLFYECLKSKVMNFLYNARFDLRWMEYQGYDMSKIHYYDVAVGVWLSDTNVKMPSLKKAERKFLGWNPSTFEQTLGEATQFQYLTPEDAYQYACADAEGTFAVALVTVTYYKEAGVAGKLENLSLYPLMKYEEETLDVDKDYLVKCIEEQTQHLKELQTDIFNTFGYQIKLNSNKQLGDALQQIGIHTGEYTATGIMKTDIKTLERVNLKNPHPVLNKIIEQSQISKSLSSYFESLLEESERMNGKARFAYLTNNVPTSRLSCGSDKKNSYFTHINIQSAPKPHPQDYYVHEYHGEELDEGEFVVLKWKFSTTKPSNYIIEGFNQKNNFRSAFIVKPDEYWVSCDYSGEELRIIANLTNEPNWVNTFLNGGDLHKAMAINMWGEENYDKEKRKKAKVLNFGMCVSDDVYIYTDKGYLRPSRLLTDNVKIGNRFNNFCDYKCVVEENQDGVEIQYGNGIIESYKKGHMVCCWDGTEFEWIAVEDIRNEQVLYSRDHIIGDVKSFIIDVAYKTISHIDLSKGWWPYLIGSLLGDGYCSKDDSGVSWVIENEILDEVVSFLEGEGFHVNVNNLSKTNIITVSSANLCRKLKELCGSGASNKRVPEKCFELYSKKELKEVLAGCIDTDGTLTDGKLFFKNTNKYLVSDVALICHILGYRTQVTSFQPGVTKDGVRSYCSKNGEPYSRCYELRINGEGDIAKYQRKRGKVVPRREEIDISEYLAWETFWIQTEKKLKDRWYNIRRGTRLTELVLNETQKAENLENLHKSLYSGGLCRVISREDKKVRSYRIQILNGAPEYLSSSIVSHNSYGMSGYSLAQKFNVSVEEGEDIVNKFWKAAPRIKDYQTKCVRLARKKGTVYNYFGLPRRVKYYLNHSDPKKRAFGVRTVNNTLIQSVGAGLLKLAFIKLWKYLGSDEYKPLIRFQNTIHDEINFAVKRDRLLEMAKLIRSCMEVTLPGFKIPFVTGIDIGTKWGACFPFKYNENDELVPDWTEVKTEVK